MLEGSRAFSGFSSNRIAESIVFYRDTLGLEIDETMGGFGITLPGGGRHFVYPKDDHVPATFTVLNFEVDDIDTAVDALNSRGIVTTIYDDPHLPTDEKGIMRGGGEYGPDIAWFLDPAGNILSVLSDARS